jgi:hypothetical protein
VLDIDLDLGELIPKGARPYILGGVLLILGVCGVKYLVHGEIEPVNVLVVSMAKDVKDLSAGYSADRATNAAQQRQLDNHEARLTATESSITNLAISVRQSVPTAVSSKPE